MPDNIATLYLNPDGSEIVSQWTGWECEGEMRFLGRDGNRVLQQQWRRYGINSVGALSVTECEWRDVPFVVGGR